MPQVSVVIPAYGHAAYIREGLESVFTQTFTDYEVIVVNDGSPDNTSEVLSPYIRTGRIIYVEQTNAGQGAARNRGLHLAKGEFIAFLDDDDVWPSDKLQWQVEALRAHRKTVLVYGYAVRHSDGVMHSPAIQCAPNGDVRDAFVGGTWISSPGQTLIRADTLRRVGGIDPTIRGADDWDFYIRLSRVGRFRFENRCALHYRVHPTNASRRWWSHYRNAKCVVKQNFPFRLDRQGGREWLASRARLPKLTAECLVAIARDDAREGRVIESLLAAMASIWLWPPNAMRRSHWRSLSRLWFRG